MLLRTLVIAALVVAPGASVASTLDVFLQGGVRMGQAAGMNSDFSFDPGPVETLDDAGSRFTQSAGDFGIGGAQAEYEFNGVTGQLRLGVRASVSDPPSGQTGPGTAASQAFIDLTERFFVSGTGTVTVGMAIDAEWVARSWFLDATTTFNGSIDFTGVSFNGNSKSFGPTTEGFVGALSNEFVEVSFEIDSPSGGLIDFGWRLNGSVVVGGRPGPGEAARLNAMNTANIFVRTEGNVTATAQTEGFLSNPAFGRPDPEPDPEVNVIPLPASALLLLASLGGLGALRRRRHSAA